ncbi:hypothetical protein NDU88_008725 [Pleurodeles waltl]|uniref:Uncharacterized protein n=1 Tax=Pleurodeles waltl TaxID=8319 RepID=A0AAV7QVI2_PLEWA|nr:hypothetical protein NDU88_008725 [Pleurodeles waltl]
MARPAGAGARLFFKGGRFPPLLPHTNERGGMAPAPAGLVLALREYTTCKGLSLVNNWGDVKELLHEGTPHHGKEENDSPRKPTSIDTMLECIIGVMDTEIELAERRLSVGGANILGTMFDVCNISNVLNGPREGHELEGILLTLMGLIFL